MSKQPDNDVAAKITEIREGRKRFCRADGEDIDFLLLQLDLQTKRAEGLVAIIHRVNPPGQLKVPVGTEQEWDDPAVLLEAYIAAQESLHQNGVALVIEEQDRAQKFLRQLSEASTMAAAKDQEIARLTALLLKAYPQYSPSCSCDICVVIKKLKADRLTDPTASKADSVGERGAQLPEAICENPSAALYNPDCYWHGTESVGGSKEESK